MYRRYDQLYPGTVSFDSGTATNPVTWEITEAGPGEITMKAINRAACCPARLAYQTPCGSTNVALLKSGLTRFRAKSIDASNGIYRLNAAARATCGTKGVSRLGPAAPANARRCDGANNGIKLLPSTSATQGMLWKFIRISPPPPPPSPPPPPPSPIPSPPPPVRQSPSPSIPVPSPPPTFTSPPRLPNFCSFPTTRKVFSGRRINSTLSGIRPCYPASARAASSGDCCNQCFANPSCVAFTFVKGGGLDCRSQGLPDVASTGACYLMDAYTGSYDPENTAFGYYSVRGFKR